MGVMLLDAALCKVVKLYTRKSISANAVGHQTELDEDLHSHGAFAFEFPGACAQSALLNIS